MGFTFEEITTDKPEKSALWQEDIAGSKAHARMLGAYEIQQQVEMGDIVVLAGLDKVCIGDTICLKESPVVLPRIDVDEPTVAMRFTINTSPFAGREGKIVQLRKIKERLEKEALTNVAIQGKICS